jgi:hypothetical protein
MRASDRIDSTDLFRNVRARSDLSAFDYAIFRDIFASRNLPDTLDPSVAQFLQASTCASSSFIFSFSFDFNEAAPTSNNTTLPYDKQIVES